MNFSDKKQPPRALSAAMAGMLALSLAACGEKPAVVTDAKDAAKKSAPPVQQPVKAPEKKNEEAAKAAADAKAKENEALAGKVKSALIAEPSLKKLTVDVTASDGDVTLFGSADTRAHRDKAAQVASKVEGVKSVKNNMAIVAGS